MKRQPDVMCKVISTEKWKSLSKVINYERLLCAKSGRSFGSLNPLPPKLFIPVDTPGGKLLATVYRLPFDKFVVKLFLGECILKIGLRVADITYNIDMNHGDPNEPY